ncbi:MAG: hypothetical protein K6U80_18735 [Firmicutes bacterium]|nr:hypothetical protein [Bacillota bacterium]
MKEFTDENVGRTISIKSRFRTIEKQIDGLLINGDNHFKYQVVVGNCLMAGKSSNQPGNLFASLIER